MAMSLSTAERKFWRGEFKILDELYEAKQEQWQRLFDVHNKKWTKKIRDLEMNEVTWIPLFYSIVRQEVATIAYNNPTMFFTVEDDEGAGADVGDILERAAASFLEITKAKLHVHQAIFDSRFTGVGWLRLDYNPLGDDMIAPYVANDAMAEDMVAVSRMPPGFVQIDPQTPPHVLGYGRYIRERMWVPLKFLRDDKTIKNRHKIKASKADSQDKLAFGEPMHDTAPSAEQKALRDSVLNDEYVLLDRVHDRMNRRQILFTDSVEDELQVIEHPFAKMRFPEVMGRDAQGVMSPVIDDNGNPVVNIEKGEPAAGWLVPQGFQFVPVKFDMSQSSFYPTPAMEQIFDLCMAATESMSRQSGALKRGAEQGLVNRSESNAEELATNLTKGQDGQYHLADNPDTAVGSVGTGHISPVQTSFEDRAMMYLQQVTRMNEMGQGGEQDPETATEAGLMAAASSILREWMESGAFGGVSGIYENVARGAFGIMGDPRYEPEAFEVNVAPGGQQRLTRALKNTDFLWNYRIKVEAGSTRPLFEELQRNKYVDFWDRASARENFDQLELDKGLASAYEVVDPEKLLRDDINEEAQRAVQLENEKIIFEMTDPGVFAGQDHQAHMDPESGHLATYQQHPRYTQLLQAAQQTDAAGNPLDVRAGQTLQFIDGLVQQHEQQHAAVEEQERSGATAPQSVAGRDTVDTLTEQVQSSAQNLSNTVQEGAVDVEG